MKTLSLDQFSMTSSQKSYRKQGGRAFSWLQGPAPHSPKKPTAPDGPSRPLWFPQPSTVLSALEQGSRCCLLLSSFLTFFTCSYTSVNADLQFLNSSTSSSGKGLHTAEDHPSRATQRVSLEDFCPIHSNVWCLRSSPKQRR